MNRRQWLFGATALSLSNAPLANAQVVESGIFGDIVDAEVLPVAHRISQSTPEFSGTLSILSLVGKDDPGAREIAIGDEILRRTPTNCSPYEVAKHLLKLREPSSAQAVEMLQFLTPEETVVTEGEAPLSKYLYAWEGTYNPLIRRFLETIGANQSDGDTVAWCAAFVTWCVLRSNIGKPPQLQSLTAKDGFAQSYLEVGTLLPVDENLNSADRQLGDLVVFRELGVGRQKLGHVGFFDGDAGPDRVHVLGGNQGKATYNKSAIRRMSFPKRTKGYEVAGYVRL